MLVVHRKRVPLLCYLIRLIFYLPFPTVYSIYIYIKVFENTDDFYFVAVDWPEYYRSVFVCDRINLKNQ